MKYTITIMGTELDQGQTVKVSDAIAKKFNHEIIWTPALTGACAIDAVGVPYPDETHEICMKADAVEQSDKIR
jgi:3-isopropylmalate dehydrogenase